MHDLALLMRLRADELFRISSTKYETNPKQKAFRRCNKEPDEGKSSRQGQPQGARL